MNKHDILSKSRKENKGRDLYKMEIEVNAASYGAIAALFLATVFNLTKIFISGSMDYGAYAVVISVSATTSIVKAIRLKRKRDIVLSIVYTLATLIFAVIHIYFLVTSS